MEIKTDISGTLLQANLSIANNNNAWVKLRAYAIAARVTLGGGAHLCLLVPLSLFWKEGCPQTRHMSTVAIILLSYLEPRIYWFLVHYCCEETSPVNDVNDNHTLRQQFCVMEAVFIWEIGKQKS